MLVLYIMAGIVFLRSITGKDIQVSRVSVLPGKRARIIALALLPLLAVGMREGEMVAIGVILYMLAYCIVAMCASVRVTA